MCASVQQSYVDVLPRLYSVVVSINLLAAPRRASRFGHAGISPMGLAEAAALGMRLRALISESLLVFASLVFTIAAP